MQCLLFDVEGTITSLSFVKDELFPYARTALPGFLEQNADRPEVQSILDRLGRELGTSGSDVQRIGATLVRWIDEDRKHTDLKELQGLIWEEGYRAGAYRGHLYPDVLPFWDAARRAGQRLAIYSSGSVQAQRLLLQYSVYGDVAHYVDRHFDTRVGPKADVDSYVRIAAELIVPPAEITFFSDAVPELDAARAAGLATYRTRRPGVPPERHAHPEIPDFTAVDDLLDDARGCGALPSGT